MNILYINHYAGSPEMGMEFRPYYLSREWVKMGHKVKIIAGDYSHLRVKNPKVKRDYQKQKIDGIDYVWMKTGSYEGNGVKRALTMFCFVVKLWANAKNIALKWSPDVVIASSTYPLDTYAAQRIAKYSGAKVIHEVHDMWPITLIELGGMKRTNPFVILMQIAENSFCKHSDYVVSLLCAAKDYFIKHGMKPEKFKTVMNGIVLDEWENAQSLPEEHKMVLDRLHNEGKFVICFFGSITKSYAIDYLIDAIKKLDDDSIALVIVGDGNQKEELIQKSKKLMKIKAIILFIVSALLIGLCWYYVAAFCAVFKNSQGHYLMNVLFAFIVCNIWPFVTSLIAPILRLKAISGNNQCLYKASQIIAYF
mgnify:CR=1 FL=1